MIYINLSKTSRKRGTLRIKGNAADIRDELAVILTELNKTPAGISLVLDALEQSNDPEWQDFYDSEMRPHPDTNRRNKHEHRNYRNYR